ncbi:MAG: hypothetical protein FP825_18085 [Hyphomonas sp.]|uniref:hypothetical protein n=1 Tax=Hyphomonas sp. TaxID=87 RepID=UPI0017E7C1D5|nr:hypothetical protein [Hyphomonas sp.]MBA3070372.1 hypothetical protein [Hyphomonas sp.]MBU3921258.1 hypothetical protein [Alphaproteobacteria bacterium]MBU4062859.1 hypothetical protein [Alphaproteobacteria bacterium]MBU4163778.1 hypothetical protein [Alphaproteobacteria bacterium]
MVHRIQEIIDRLSTNGSLKVRSAANPILWMVGTICAVTTAAMFTKPPTWALIVLMAVFAVTVVVTLGIFIFMVWKRPDDLRSEEYLLEERRISMYRDAHSSGTAIPTSELKAIPDPKKVGDSDEHD